MENKDTYRRKIDALLTEWEDKIDILVTKADTATAGARSRYQEQLQALQAKQEVARHKLDELKEDSGEAWEAIKEGMEEAWDDLKEAFEKAATKFSDEENTRSSEAMVTDFVCEANTLSTELAHFQQALHTGDTAAISAASKQLLQVVTQAEAFASEADVGWLRFPREQQQAYLQVAGKLVVARQELHKRNLAG